MTQLQTKHCSVLREAVHILFKWRSNPCNNFICMKAEKIRETEDKYNSPARRVISVFSKSLLPWNTAKNIS